MSVGQVSTPFVDSNSFITEEAETESPEIRSALTARTPFVSVYESADGESAFDDPVREAYSSLVDELYDEEFDEALFELLTDVRNMHQDQLASGNPVERSRPASSRNTFLSSCGNRKRWWTRSAREFGSRDNTGMVEGEIETFFEQYSRVSADRPIVRELLRKADQEGRQGGGKGRQGDRDDRARPHPQQDQGARQAAVESSPAKSHRKTSGSRSASSTKTCREAGICCAETGGTADGRGRRPIRRRRRCGDPAG